MGTNWGPGCWQALPGAGTRLKFFKASLEAEGSYDAAVQGCKYVLHMASVVRMSAARGRERELLIDPSVNGVANVLGMYHCWGQYLCSGDLLM